MKMFLLTTLVLDHDLAVVTGKFLVNVDRALVQEDVREGVVHRELVLLQDDGLEKALNALLENENSQSKMLKSEMKMAISAYPLALLVGD